MGPACPDQGGEAGVTPVSRGFCPASSGGQKPAGPWRPAVGAGRCCAVGGASVAAAASSTRPICPGWLTAYPRRPRCPVLRR